MNLIFSFFLLILCQRGYRRNLCAHVNVVFRPSYFTSHLHQQSSNNANCSCSKSGHAQGGRSRFFCFHVIVTIVFRATKLIYAVCSCTRFARCSGSNASRCNVLPFLVGIETIFIAGFTRSYARRGRIESRVCKLRATGFQISRFSNSYVFLEWGHRGCPRSRRM